MSRTRTIRRDSAFPESRRMVMLACALAAAALVVFLPGGFARWFLPKETVFALAIAAAAFVPAAGRLSRVAWGFLGAAGAVLVLAALLGEAPVAQLLGRAPRFEGLVSIPVYVGAAWFGARMFGPAPQGRRRADRWILALAFAAIAIGVVAALEAAGLRPIPSDLDRPGSLLGNATDQGIVGAALAILLSAPVVRAFASRRPERGTVLAAGLLAAVLSVVLSGSRAGLLALAVGGTVLFTVHLVIRRRDQAALRPLLLGGALSATGLALVVAVLPGVGARLVGLTPTSAQTVSDRLLIWRESLELLGAKLGFGVGPSGYATAIAPVHSDEWYRTVTPGMTLDSPHNLALQALSAGGLPLLALAVALGAFAIVLAVRRIAATTRSPGARDLGPVTGERDLLVAALAGTTAITVALLTHFSSAATAVLAGILLGVLLARDPRAVRTRRLLVLHASLLAAWAVALGVTTSADVVIESALRSRTALESDAWFDTARVLRPWDGDLSSVAARSFAARADLGDPEAAALGVEWGERALTLIPTDASAQLALGVALRQVDDAEASLAVLRPLAHRLSGDRDVAIQLGISLAVTGDLAGAREVWEQALTLHPGDPLLGALVARID